MQPGFFFIRNNEKRGVEIFKNPNEMPLLRMRNFWRKGEKMMEQIRSGAYWRRRSWARTCARQYAEAKAAHGLGTIKVWRKLWANYRADARACMVEVERGAA
jgi:hypothetical protein